MLFLKKHKAHEKLPGQTANDKVAGYISQQIRNIQIRFALIMNKIFGKMSPMKLKVFLFAFCIGWGGYSIFLAFGFLVSHRENEFIQHPGSIKKPNYFNKTGEPLNGDDVVISAEEIEKLGAFNKYLDSLKLNNRYFFDSLIQTRPGLIDSAHIMEEIITSKIK